MIGVYDFCGHYDWTFAWLERTGGENLLHEFWEAAIGADSQRHATEMIVAKGFEGMKEYWGHTLTEEGAGYRTTVTEHVFRIDMHQCPSKGFLIRSGLVQCRDYCDHCMGWIGPLMRKAGYVVDHEHDHGGRCWWEMRRADDHSSPGSKGELAGEHDVRLRQDWGQDEAGQDSFSRANSVKDKEKSR